MEPQGGHVLPRGRGWLCRGVPQDWPARQHKCSADKTKKPVGGVRDLPRTPGCEPPLGCASVWALATRLGRVLLQMWRGGGG